MTFWFPDGSSATAQSQPVASSAEATGACVEAFRAAPIERVRTCLGRAPVTHAGSAHSDNDNAPTSAGGFRLPDGALA
ncbi:hypothetical protein [Lysobacter sp.]|uniref:hypothetical protein n=1 Tax=Lysobacter sp. TaxID=72226 RepID=UPI002D47F174|nr:hypothetical protein [Lysobacter sp.]HZX76259.1 hypothetical protein [Lysobacter sp.]